MNHQTNQRIKGCSGLVLILAGCLLTAPLSYGQQSNSWFRNAELFIRPEFGIDLFEFDLGEPDAIEYGFDMMDWEFAVTYTLTMGIVKSNYRLGLTTGFGRTYIPDEDIIEQSVQKTTQFGIMYNGYIFDVRLGKSSVSLQMITQAGLSYWNYAGKYEDMEAYYSSDYDYEFREPPLLAFKKHAFGAEAGAGFGVGMDMNKSKSRLTLGWMPANVFWNGRVTGWGASLFLNVDV